MKTKWNISQKPCDDPQVSIPSPKGNITTTRSNIKQISLSWNLSAISFCQVTSSHLPCNSIALAKLAEFQTPKASSENKRNKVLKTTILTLWKASKQRLTSYVWGAGVYKPLKPKGWPTLNKAIIDHFFQGLHLHGWSLLSRSCPHPLFLF